MKKFLKHCNRGLLLGLAVLLGLILYLKADSMRFEKSKAEIENTVTEYLTEVKKVNLAPAGRKSRNVRRSWNGSGLPKESLRLLRSGKDRHGRLPGCARQSGQ